jgi:hypothetical protein
MAAGGSRTMPASGQEKAALGAARGRPFRQPSSRARRSGGGAASEGARGSHALRMPKLARFVNHARAGSERAARHRTLKLHRGPGVRRRRLLSRPGRTAWSSARGRPCGAGRSPRPGRTRRTAVPLRSGWPRRTPVARRSGRSRRSRRTGRAGLPWGARRRHRREYGRSGAGGRRAGISLRARLSLRTGLTAPGDRRFARLGRCRKCHDAARRVINDPELEIPAPIGALDEAVVEPDLDLALRGLADHPKVSLRDAGDRDRDLSLRRRREEHDGQRQTHARPDPHHSTRSTGASGRGEACASKARAERVLSP